MAGSLHGVTMVTTLASVDWKVADMDYTVKDDSNGNVTLRCEHGEVYTRTNSLGMFCGKDDCKCEKRSLELVDRLGGFMAKLGLESDK